MTVAMENTTFSLNEDSQGEQEFSLEIATIVEISVGCALAVGTVAIILILFCKGAKCDCFARWCRYGEASPEEYEKIKDRESRKVRGRTVLGHFCAGKSAKQSEAACVKPVPFTRIHPASPTSSPAGTPPPPSSRSPAITRASHNIPFELPPCAHARLTETWQIQPEMMCEMSRYSFHQSESSCSSEDLENSPHTTPIRKSQSGLTSRCSSSPLADNNGYLTRSPEQYRNQMLGRIQPELYKYSANIDNDLHQSRCGRVWFSMVYDGAVETLTVKIIKVKQLQSRANNNASRCSFVKVFLLPDEKFSHQTKVKMQTNNPTFNETFVFQVSDSDVRNRSLRFSVYDVDKRKTTRHLLGHALVGLNDIDPSKANEVLWRDLDDIAHPGDSGASLGEINVALTYVPSMERLTVVILEAKNLRKMDLESTGIYVKVSLTQGHHVIKSKKTATQDGASDPRYHESFSFKVTPKDLEQTCLSITVITNGGRGTISKVASSLKNTVTRGRYGAEHKYGRVAIGSFMYCRSEQLLHWQEMVAQPRKSIAKWHSLSEFVANQ